jgi:hypothetical protein
MFVICVCINLRLLTWERPEWRQAGRRRFNTGDNVVNLSSHSNS